MLVAGRKRGDTERLSFKMFMTGWRQGETVLSREFSAGILNVL
jgi:hypothetical protein